MDYGLEEITKGLEKSNFLEGMVCITKLGLTPGAFLVRARQNSKQDEKAGFSNYVVAAGFEISKLYITGTIISELLKGYF